MFEKPEAIRLDRFLANAHVGSRSEVRRLIKTGAVTVNGVIVREPSQKISHGDVVSVHGRVVESHRNVYIVLNKPRGYVSTTSSREPSVLLLVDHPYASELHIAGRLDKDVEGLLILTNDGDFTHKVISPKSNVEKEYVVETWETVTIDTTVIREFENGLLLDDGRVTLPARITQLDEKTVSITLREGRYHQVKRMCSAVGLRYKRIVRVRIGGLELASLPTGSWRELSGLEAYGAVLMGGKLVV